MRTINHTSENYLLKTLIKRNTPHTIIRTRNTTRIKTELPNGEPIQYLISDSPLSFQDLGFINQVKRAATKSSIAPEGNTAKNVSYFRFKPLAEGVHRDVVEIDVNAAYWEIAHRRGIIPRKVYEKGKTVSKRVRLVALGAMATQKRQWEYDPEKGKYIQHPVKFDEKLRSYFFDIAKDLDLTMERVGAYDDVLFYWVDAFFLKRSLAEKVKQSINAAGLACKTIELDRIEVSRLKSGRYMANVYDILNPEPRPFCWGDDKVNAEFIIKCVVGTVKAALA